MAEELQEQGTETVKKEMLDIESQVKEAMVSRVIHFKAQADSLTFEGVRRLLEKDLGLEKFALDVHKRFVKQCLFECLDSAVAENASKGSQETGQKHVGSPKEGTESPEILESKNNIKEPSSEEEEKMEECHVTGLSTGQKTTKSKTKDTQANEIKVPSDHASKDSGETGRKHAGSPKEGIESPERLESKNNIKEHSSEEEEKMEDSPVMGLMTGKKTTKSKTKDTQANEIKEVPSEGSIKKAMMKRASYIKANSEEITMAGLRRLLEDDLKLDKFSLDPYKKFISKQLDEVLKSSRVSEPKKKNLKNNSHGKASKGVSSEESANSSDKESEEEEEEVKLKKKKIGAERQMQNAQGSKKRRRSEKETKVSAKKQIKPSETVTEDNNDMEDSGDVSEDKDSPSSAEKPVKKKEASTPAYGKRVEHLKSVIKSCGMSVPPVIYKKVKQVADNKREAQLIKELEDILSREGLSSNPSEKEIKEVRKRKERAKELEGIDLSNIVTTSRRRSATSFVAPKPKVLVESESDDTDDTEDDDEDGEDNNEDDGDDNGGVDSPSEEADEGK
ncbi:zinc finger CCCH domain-containing protein 15 [Populus alba x Populus x berolinensis]|uniref:Zinc finger CCCH domain-containing protein 15 n=1 Tax=Populus alba x Populus x berolinensis TaxID=444605 RepID=A0AAD6QWC0_9ROSI|nr:zinc finger CCCH domain-containing protein 15 [Populus alba x Populus x berolinensis]